MLTAAGNDASPVLHQVNNIFRHITNVYFNAHSLLVLVLSLAASIVLGRIVAALLRRVVVSIGHQADRTENLHTVNRLRRYETIIVLSIAVIRTFLVLLGLYFWWMYIHPNQQPTAIIGASALLAIIIGSALSPALRDIASGSVMMAEQWYTVGDHVRIDPFSDLKGVVERVTLRSTRIRGLNGDVIWVNNQNIQGVRITPKGIVTIAIELFVNDLDKAQRLLDAVNRRLPIGQLLVITPLQVMTTEEAGDNLWRLTAIGEAAPDRDWLLKEHAVKILQALNESEKLDVLEADPVARFADGETERRFVRALQNTRKAPRTRRRPAVKRRRKTR